VVKDVDRLVVELDRLHRECTPRLILNTTAAQRLAQLVARDREQLRPRRLWSRRKAKHRGKRGGERLSGEIKRFLRAAHPAAEEREDRSGVALVEDAERLRARARREQELGVERCSPSFTRLI